MSDALGALIEREFRQSQDFYDLLVNPFIVGDWVYPAGDEKGLQELAKGMVQPVESLEI